MIRIMPLNGNIVKRAINVELQHINQNSSEIMLGTCKNYSEIVRIQNSK